MHGHWYMQDDHDPNVVGYYIRKILHVTDKASFFVVVGSFTYIHRKSSNNQRPLKKIKLSLWLGEMEKSREERTQSTLLTSMHKFNSFFPSHNNRKCTITSLSFSSAYNFLLMFHIKPHLPFWLIKCSFMYLLIICNLSKGTHIIQNPLTSPYINGQIHWLKNLLPML